MTGLAATFTKAGIALLRIFVRVSHYGGQRCVCK